MKTLLPCTSAIALALLTPSLAVADDGEACRASYTSTQQLRRAGELLAAKEQALACAREVCSEVVRTDCIRWVDEIAAATPTVIFVVRDASGLETAAARIELDGAPWLESLDGTAREVDPGEHVFRVTIDGAPTREERLVARENEKGRRVDVSFAPEPGPAPASPAPTPGSPAPDPAAEPEGGGVPTWAWVAGGGGVALIGTGVVFGVLASSADARLHEQCAPSFETCNETLADGGDKSDVVSERNTMLGLAGAVGGVGLVAVAAALVGVVTAPGDEAPGVDVAFAPAVSPTFAGGAIRGGF